jgi:hypothetical protein
MSVDPLLLCDHSSYGVVATGPSLQCHFLVVMSTNEHPWVQVMFLYATYFSYVLYDSMDTYLCVGEYICCALTIGKWLIFVGQKLTKYEYRPVDINYIRRLTNDNNQRTYVLKFKSICSLEPMNIRYVHWWCDTDERNRLIFFGARSSMNTRPVRRGSQSRPLGPYVRQNWWT